MQKSATSAAGQFSSRISDPCLANASRRLDTLVAEIRKSFLASDRAYGARRVLHELLEAGLCCKLYAIERLMTSNALRTRREAPPAK